MRRAELRATASACCTAAASRAERRELMRAFKARRARRARRDDGDRGRRRRAERDDHDRAGGRPLRPRPAPPAARPRRPRRRAVVLPADLARQGGADRRRAQARLQALVDTTDGFELAERDLELRGEGQLLGTRQSGLTDLRFTRLRADRDLLERARELADELVDDEGPLNDEVDRFFAGAEADSLA